MTLSMQKMILPAMKHFNGLKMKLVSLELVPEKVYQASRNFFSTNGIPTVVNTVENQELITDVYECYTLYFLLKL